MYYRLVIEEKRMPRRRTRPLIILLTDEEKASVEDGAKKVGMTISAFVRLLIRQWADGIRFERRERSNETVQSNQKGGA